MDGIGRTAGDGWDGWSIKEEEDRRGCLKAMEQRRLRYDWIGRIVGMLE